MRLLENRKIRLSLLAASGLSMALTVMFPVLGALEWFALIPFALVLFFGIEQEGGWKSRFLELLVFFGAYFLALYHWFFYMYPMEFLGISEWAAAVVVVVAWLGLPLLQAVPFAFLFLLWYPVSRTKLVRKYNALLPFFAAALWVLFEWCTTLTWAGVPWSRLALGQVNMLAVLQTASLFGSYFITFLIVAVNFLLGYAIFYRKRAILALPIALFSVNLLVGGIMLSTYEVENGEPVKIAAIQGNASSSEKWSADAFLSMLERHRRLTLEAAEEAPEIIVWTESTVPDVLPSMPSTMSYIGRCAVDSNSLLLAGGFDLDEAGDQYNTTFLFDKEGNISDDRYYKRHLVPFGEFIPLRGLVEVLIPPLANINALGEDLSPGEGANLIETEHGELGSLICFDSIYEELARESVLAGAKLIVIPTNDSWFSDSAALSMHHAQARLRAIENRRFVVRAANTGISSFISPTGEVLESLGANKTGYICENVYMQSELTLYTRLGNVFVLVCGLYAALLLGAHVIEKKKKAVA